MKFYEAGRKKVLGKYLLKYTHSGEFKIYNLTPFLFVKKKKTFIAKETLVSSKFKLFITLYKNSGDQ